MFDTQLRIRLIVFGLLSTIAILIFAGPLIVGEQSASLFNKEKAKYLTVTFLDVGQGDAIFIETPDGVQMLIDAGPDSSVLRGLSESMPAWDRTIDVVLATHSDKDHIGGLVGVLERYKVSHLVRTENKNDTAVASAFATAEKNEGVDVILARAGQQFSLGASTTVLILSPATNPEEWESNSASIVTQIIYGDIEFMLTGDAPIGIEEYLADSYGDLLESEVLKLGHHGSRTSTSDLFLDKVQPLFAVVSAGQDNRYGHPHAEVIEEVTKRNIETHSTVDEGSIVFKSDGEKVWVK